jgi:tetratricopeptide (TPR) repeat protein
LTQSGVQPDALFCAAEIAHPPHEGIEAGGVASALASTAPPMVMTDRDAARLRESGRLDEAVDMLRQILDVRPHDVGALAELGRVRRRQGDRAAALAAFEAAVAGNPSHAGLQVEMAGELRELGRLDEAEALLRGVLERQSQQVDALVGLAQIARRRGDRVASLAMFEAAAAASPDHAGVKAELASDLRELGRFDEAEALLRGVLERQPQQVDALVELAQIARRRGDRVASLALFEAAAAASPDHAGVKAELASELRELGRLDEAEALLRGVLDCQPQQVDALVGFAQIARRRGDRAASLAKFEAAAAANPNHLGVKLEAAADLRELGRLDDAEALLRGVLELQPQQVDALVGLAQIARRRGDRVVSLAMFEAAAAANPNHLGVRLEAAADLRELARFDEAEVLLRSVLDRQPRQVDVLVGLAQIARRRGDRAASLAMFEAAAAANPNHLGVKLEAAADLRELGRLDNAEVLLRQVLDREGTNFGALVGLGHVLRQRGDRAGSLASFEAAAAADPSHIGAMLEAVNSLRDLGRIEEAAARLERLLAANPANVTALVRLGTIRLEHFQLEEAELLFRRAVAAAPGDPMGHLSLGYLARRRADREIALAHFEAAQATNPNHSGAALEIAAELRELGRHAEARTFIDNVLRANPGDYQAGMQMAYLHRKINDRRVALELFGAAYERQPREVQPLVEMAVEQRALGRPEQSAELLRRALALDPIHLGALEQLSEHQRLAEHFEESLAVSRRAIAAHPHKLTPYLNASRAAAELGHTEEAAQLLDTARDMAGPSPEIRALQITHALMDRDWAAARALLGQSGPETRRYAGLWTQCMAFAITTGDYAGAEAALSDVLPSTVHEASRVYFFRGQIAEARWQLTAAATHYAQAIALEPNDGGAHADLARTSLKLLDLEACRFHLRRLIEIDASAKLLRRQSLGVSQGHLGQLLQEFAIDREQLEALQRIRALAPEKQIGPLKELVARDPDHTPSAMMLLIAMREAGALVLTPSPPPDGSFAHIPRRFVQYWNEADPPSEIAALMASWRERHPGFDYFRFDDRTAQEFLSTHRMLDVLNAYRRAREPAQRADIFRLAYLSIFGGFYADADDRCLAAVGSFVPPDARFVAFQEDFGTLGNNFLAVVPDHPIINLALQLGTNAINRGDADMLWLSTGPGLLTRAFAQLLARPESSLERLGAVILDMGFTMRHIGLRCPVRYKTTNRHWSRSTFGKAED